MNASLNEKLRAVKWGEFKYKEVFNRIEQGRRLKKDDQIDGTIPFVMSGTTNAGVVNYISNPVASFPKNAITIDIFGNTFYRNYAFGAGDDTGVYWNDATAYSSNAMLFFAVAMQKSMMGRFSYGKKLLFNENTMSTVKLSNLATNDVDTKEKYDDCTNRNISQNIIRNNIVYSSYICIRNALICVLVLFVLVSIPFTTAKSKDNNMMDSSESSISYSETIIIPDSIGVTDVSNCIIQDREDRNSIEDGTIYSFVNTNKNYYVQYKCFGSEIIVEKLFCFDKVING